MSLKHGVAGSVCLPTQEDLVSQRVQFHTKCGVFFTKKAFSIRRHLLPNKTTCFSNSCMLVNRVCQAAIMRPQAGSFLLRSRYAILQKKASRNTLLLIQMAVSKVSKTKHQAFVWAALYRRIVCCACFLFWRSMCSLFDSFEIFGSAYACRNGQM